MSVGCLAHLAHQPELINYNGNNLLKTKTKFSVNGNATIIFIYRQSLRFFIGFIQAIFDNYYTEKEAETEMRLSCSAGRHIVCHYAVM